VTDAVDAGTPAGPAAAPGAPPKQPDAIQRILDDLFKGT